MASSGPDERSVAVVLVGEEGRLGLALDERPALDVDLVGEERLYRVDSHREEEIGLAEDFSRRLHRREAENTEDAEKVGMGLVDDPLAVERGDDRRAELLGEHLDRDAAAERPAADDDDRQPISLDLLRDDLDGRHRRRHQPEVARLVGGVEPEDAVVRRDLRREEVGRQRQVHGALLLPGDADEVSQERHELVRVRRGGAVGEHGAVELRLADVLELPVPLLRRRHRAGEGEHRYAVEIGIDDAAERIEGAGARGRDADAEDRR